MADQQWLVVIFGPPATERTDIALRVADALGGKTAIVRHDDLIQRWIAGHSDDTAAEHDMTYMQVKLLVSLYLRNRYSVVIDGAYSHAIDGQTHNYDGEIEQLKALMRAMPVRTVTVFLYRSGQYLAASGISVPNGESRTRALSADLSFDLASVPSDRALEEILTHLGRA